MIDGRRNPGSGIAFQESETVTFFRIHLPGTGNHSYANHVKESRTKKKNSKYE